MYSSPSMNWVIVKNNEMDGLCSTYGERRGACVIFVRIPGEREHLENVGVDRIILTWIFKKWGGIMDWIDVTQDKDRWYAVVNKVIKPCIR